MSHRNKRELRRQREMQRERGRAQARERAERDAPVRPARGGRADNDDDVLYVTQYEITHEPMRDRKWALPPEVQDQYEELHDLIMEKRAAEAIPRVEALLEAFANVPQLYNQLASAYSLVGNDARAEEWARIWH